MSIVEDDFLLKRIPISNDPNHKYIKDDGSISSLAFMPTPKDRAMDNGGLSVNIKRLSSYEHTVLDESKYGVIEFPVKASRELGLIDKYDPLDDNPAHAIILGLDKGKSVRRKLAKKASLLLKR